ncbi:MAG: WG repeat-containing protein, partial [Bacteroidetes bacterium]|nr:WG repeat-containing protein [Bacteroidota bacterium]
MESLKIKFRISLVSLLILTSAFCNAQGDKLARVKKGGKYGFVNMSGTVVIPITYTEAGDFGEGLAAVKVGEVWGAVDKSNKIVIKPQFADQFRFKKGMATVSKPNKPGTDVIDKTGRTIFHTDYNFVFFNSFIDGVEPVSNDKEKFGLINKLGKLVLDCKYEDIKPFSEGLAVYKGGLAYGYLDKTGKVIVQNKYTDAVSFTNGLGMVKIQRKIAYVDKTGKEVVPIGAYTNVFSYTNRKIRVARGTKIGYLDSKGAVIIPP